MLIGVGSQNQIKVSAVRAVLSQYKLFMDSHVVAISAPSGVAEQPLSLEATILGASNRAKTASVGTTLGFGIESGLMKVPGTISGYMDGCVCAICGEGTYALGISPLFECPPYVTHLVLTEGLDLNQAFLKAGITENEHIGSGDGAIGLLTGGRVTRQMYTELAIKMAMMQIEFSEFYGPLQI